MPEMVSLKKNSYGKSPVVFTIGHSTLALITFINILQAHSVTLIVDIRTIPRSRYNPQFNYDTLPKILHSSGIGYRHMPGLGGLRHAKKGSPNTGWHNVSFQGFADYMMTEEFDKNLAELIQLATREQIALMCAESVPWRCHRSLIADALLVHGISVEHIMGPSRRTVHNLTPFGRINGTSITYPPESIDSIQ